MKTVPGRLRYFNIWCQVGVLFGEVMYLLGCRALLEEVCHRRRGLSVYSHIPLPVLSQLLRHGGDVTLSFLILLLCLSHGCVCLLHSNSCFWLHKFYHGHSKVTNVKLKKQTQGSMKLKTTYNVNLHGLLANLYV